MLEAQHHGPAIAVPQGRLPPLRSAGYGLEHHEIEAPAVGHQLMQEQIERVKALAISEA